MKEARQGLTCQGGDDLYTWVTTVASFPIYKVSSLDSEDLEQLGTKPKYWYHDGDRRMMFKAENRQTGEDWAERIACEICQELGLPHVHYELAFDTHQNLPGVICQNIAAKPRSLILGNQLLLEVDPAYPSADEKHYSVQEHTVDAVWEVVSKLAPPDQIASVPHEASSAGAVFIGYTILDALIANQDRHHQNWGAVRGDTTQLAPTFDHGAGLARNETDLKRRRRLDAGDSQRQMDAYTSRARSAFFRNSQDTRTITTYDAAEAFSQRNIQAATIWLQRLQHLSPHKLSDIVNRVPESRISLTAREFTIRLLEINRTRLLNLIATL
ncbi:HipA domain-containing protein [Rosistilla carotiformis]|uniref:phosphatidylinositol kinase n=1 Tax=Rosistilla carotiformis TaxID=2528017 RepID=UPI00119D4A13|nr:phosphatidylinositol kinase [Rosistilla carotiformis]